jgi:hypothetical protein
MTKKEREIEKCLEWLADEGISAYEDSGKVYITAGEYDYEISRREIYYRAELQSMADE